MNSVKNIERKKYKVEIDTGANSIKIVSFFSNKVVFSFCVDSAIDVLDALDNTKAINFVETKEVDDYTQLVFEIESSVWDKKTVYIDLYDDTIEYYIKVEGNGQRISDFNYLLNRGIENRTEYQEIYVPRFDWFKAQVIKSAKENDTLACQQWLSPPPFAYAMVSDDDCVYVGAAPKIGEYNFLSFDYNGEQGPYFTLTYEGHTKVDSAFVSPKLLIGFGAKECNEAIENYVKYMRANGYLAKEQDKDIPNWWKEPIFCSWGQMRYDYREDHEGHENGTFINVTNYSTEKLHRNYIDIMEQNGVNPGTIIIDMGWAENPALHNPSTKRWFDLRRFIDDEHEKGRKVLLWYTPVVTQGLPDEACMMLDGKKVSPDPTSQVYQKILSEEIYKMLSSDDGCLNADGFKIDFTQCVASENGRFTSYLNSFWALINDDNKQYMYDRLDKRDNLISTYGNKWGVEILRLYMELIYINMKKVKSDSMLITHTANPYFAEVVDVLRLNDLDGECDDVLGVMTNRAAIAKMCSKNWLLDTDNDLMINKQRWREYIKLQPKLGIPDTYYVKSIAMSGELFGEEDYQLLRDVWQEYRDNLK